MDYRIVTEPSKKIREIARHVLAGFWKPVILAVFIYYLMSTGVSLVLDNFFSYEMPAELYGESYSTRMAYGGSLYLFIIGGPLEFGLMLYLLTFFRSKVCRNDYLFEGFSNFSKSFVLMILITVKVFLWSLLLFVPGIIASIRYSQAFYIMIDNPQLTPGQCIRESCRMMSGNKAKYFCLSLSFIGWYILASIAEGTFTVLNMTPGLTAVIITLILGIPTIIVDVYVYVSSTAFYELATRRLVVVENPPAQ